MRRALTDDQFLGETDNWNVSAFRLEVKLAYYVVGERASIARFRSGQHPQEDEYTRGWLQLIAAKAKQGALLTRLRVVDEPLTEYQKWLTWQDDLNRSAGESIHYLKRKTAIKAGLPATPADPDWWLFDDERLLVVHHDNKGRRRRAVLTTNRGEVQQARMWRDLAISTARKETK